MHLALVKRLEGLNFPRNNVVGLTGSPDMTIAVYRGRKATNQQQQQRHQKYRVSQKKTKKRGLFLKMLQLKINNAILSKYC